MKPHKGMRPQDVVILLKIIAKGGEPWQKKDLAEELSMSSSEITESLNRSEIAMLIDGSKKRVLVNSLMDFLFFGLRYVFPAQPGALARGTPTAHSAPLLKKHFSSEENYVWADPEGTMRGQAIEPLYSTVSLAAKLDKKLYELLVLTDTLRVGKVREMKLARELLQKLSKEYANQPA